FKIDESNVSSLAFAPDGKTLAAGLINKEARGAGKLDRSNRIHLWDIASGQQRWKVDAPDGQFCHLDFSPDGKKVISAHSDKKIHVWDADTGKQLSGFEIVGHRHWLQTVAFSPDGRLAATNGFDGNVFVWDLATGKQLHAFRFEDGVGYRLM